MRFAIGKDYKMNMVERVERVARIVLWLALAAAVSIAPVSYIRARAAEAEREQADKAAERAAEEAKEAREKAEKDGADKRILLASMGEYLVGLNATTATGNVIFTNASPRRGVVCIQGDAENPTTHAKATSLAACKAVAPYDSSEHLDLLFAGGELRDLCPTQTACRLSVKDLPVPAAAATSTPPTATPSASATSTPL
jgi:hypothetical protein